MTASVVYAISGPDSTSSSAWKTVSHLIKFVLNISAISEISDLPISSSKMIPFIDLALFRLDVLQLPCLEYLSFAATALLVAIPAAIFMSIFALLVISKLVDPLLN
eukprot:GHVR01108762.1.p1 GENE.GHVR01108762.1~~GHVR01108762.1.p1  ORF type:complete len:106 (-),score=5.62 GHVR01108762.1:33-350(-)